MPFFCAATAVAEAAPAVLRTLQTRYATIRIDARGFITSLVSRQSGKEYCPPGQPSPLLSLHENGQPNDRLLLADLRGLRTGKDEIQLKYPNGATAVVKAAAKDDYFRFQLVSLAPRGDGGQYRLGAAPYDDLARSSATSSAWSATTIGPSA